VLPVSRFADKLFCAIIIFEIDIDMVMVMVHDGSETPLEFNE
jgi:hypothetical protein